MTSSLTIKGNALYTPNGAAQEYAPVGCNFYVGCSNGCRYCYLKKGVLAHAMGAEKPQLKKCFDDEKHAFAVFQKEATEYLAFLRKTGIFFSFSTDPLLPECQKLTWYATEIASVSGIPVKILTKCTGFFKTFGPYLKNLPEKQKNIIHFGFTLTGRDDWEPNAPSNEERIKTLLTLKEWGFNTFVSIEPVIDFDSSLDMIVKTKDASSWYGIGLMTKNGFEYDANKAQDFFNKVNEIVPKTTTVLWKKSFRKLMQDSSMAR